MLLLHKEDKHIQALPILGVRTVYVLWVLGNKRHDLVVFPSSGTFTSSVLLDSYFVRHQRGLGGLYVGCESKVSIQPTTVLLARDSYFGTVDITLLWGLAIIKDPDKSRKSRMGAILSPDKILTRVSRLNLGRSPKV